MKRYAEDTKVPISKSRAEIDSLLRSWGVDGIQWGDDFQAHRVSLRFVWRRKVDPPERYLARFSIQLPSKKSLEPRAIDGRTGQVSERKMRKLLLERGMHEHRILLLWLKAALNAVEAGIVTAEAIFLPFLEGRDGQTVSEVAIPNLGRLLVGGADRLLPEVTSEGEECKPRGGFDEDRS